MNPAITAALAASQHSAHPDPVTRLSKAGAVDSASAMAIEAPSDAERQMIDKAIFEGLVQRRADGRLYVNQRAVSERNARIATTLVVGTLIGLSIMASAAALLIFAT